MKQFCIGFCILLTCGWICSPAYSQDYYHPRMRASFAWASYLSGKYNTALTESELLLGSGVNSDSLHYLAARSLLQLNRLDDALVHFRALPADTGSFYRMGLAAEGLSAFHRKAAASVDSLAAALSLTRDRYRDYGNLLRLSMLLQQTDTTGYKTLKSQISIRDVYVRHALIGLDGEVEKLGGQKHRSAAKAGVLSAIVPGTGKMYLGRWGPGLVTLAGSAALGLQAWEGYHKGGVNDVQFITFSSLFVLSYAANIYSSVIQTKAYNVQIVTDFRQGVALQVDLAFDRLFRD